MTYKIRRSGERGHFDHGWLNTYHTFSFSDYYDPNFMGFRDLRVINEDRVKPGRGFPSHDHENMEIISVVLEGELAHEDSIGTKSVIKAGEVQAMSAGSGVAHSEYNPSATDLVHFLQIWIVPETEGNPPRHQQMQLPSRSSNHWHLIASNSGREKSLKIRQDVELFALFLESGKKEAKTLLPSRYAWIQVIEGDLKFDQDILHTGDGVAIEPNTPIEIEALTPSRILLFDLN
jgi:redox-sensitive bicupin YhaK (pirin superfamily)